MSALITISILRHGVYHPVKGAPMTFYEAAGRSDVRIHMRRGRVMIEWLQ